MAGHKPLLVVSQNADSLKVFAPNKELSSQFIQPGPKDAYAELHFINGKKRREDFYYGFGYLLQSVRALAGKNLIAVYLTDYQGKRRQVNLNNTKPRPQNINPDSGKTKPGL